MITNKTEIPKYFLTRIPEEKKQKTIEYKPKVEKTPEEETYKYKTVQQIIKELNVNEFVCTRFKKVKYIKDSHNEILARKEQKVWRFDANINKYLHAAAVNIYSMTIKEHQLLEKFARNIEANEGVESIYEDDVLKRLVLNTEKLRKQAEKESSLLSQPNRYIHPDRHSVHYIFRNNKIAEMYKLHISDGTKINIRLAGIDKTEYFNIYGTGSLVALFENKKWRWSKIMRKIKENTLKNNEMMHKINNNMYPDIIRRILFWKKTII